MLAQQQANANERKMVGDDLDRLMPLSEAVYRDKQDPHHGA
jgi:hypothetical protein